MDIMMMEVRFATNVRLILKHVHQIHFVIFLVVKNISQLVICVSYNGFYNDGTPKCRCNLIKKIKYYSICLIHFI